MIGEFEHQTFR